MRKRDLRVIFTVSGGWAGRPLAPHSIGYDSTYELDGGWISANCSATQWNPTRHEGVLNLNDGVTAIGGGQSTDYSPFYDRNDVTGVDLSQSKIRMIGDYTFYGCTGLETIDIPSTVNEIGDYAFDCENLTAVICRATVPPALGSHNFTNENDFLYVPEGSVEAYQNDEDWSGAFLRIYPIGYVQHTIRYNAETAVSGNWVADNTDTGLNEFDEETGDGVLYLNTGVTSIGGGQSTDYSPFYNKTDLVSVDLDDSGITNIDRFTFNGCTSLASFDFPSGLTEVGGYTFNGCTALTSIVIPEGIVTVRGSAFRGCSSLASVSFPSTLTTIGGNSFRGTALTSVTIPSGVTLIDPYAFDCASLTTVTCNATTPPVLESNNFTATGDTLYVPYASLEAYENDTDWSSVFTSIRPIGYTYITVGAGEHGSATGSGWYQVDAYVIITATADEHYHFDRWNDGNTSNPRAIIVGSTDTTYTASFAVDEFTLIATGDAHTTVTGSGTYPYGTEVQITATPAEHYHFTSWSDGDTTNPRTVTVTGNMTLSATSAINTYTITVSAGQHGTATGSGTYPYGSFVQISATADSDYHFSQWNDGNTDNPRTITVTADATYTASFESDSYTITVNASGHGTATGSGTYPYGTQVQISATADTYYRFTAWNDGNTDNPRTVTVTGNATYTASIEAIRTISYNAGTVASGNWVDNNTETALNSYDSQTGDGVLYLKAGVTSIGNGNNTDYTPFFQKTDLVSVDLSDSGLTTIDRYAFFGCTAMVDADIPSSVTTINSFAFRNCSSLTSLAIPSSVTTIGGSVWVSCSALTSISVASGNTAFNDGNGSNCIIETSTNILKVGCKNTVIPNNITAIGDAAFSGMGLTSITIPSGVTTIGNYAFYSSVSTVTCLATTPPTLGTNNFNRGGDMLYVPYASLSSYQNDSNWRTVFTSIRPIDYSYITVTAGANGSASGSGWYEIGTTATITATPDTGYEFSQWNDGNTDNPRSVTVGSTDDTYTASFEVEVLNVIRYNSSTEATGDWVTNNTDTTRNTYDSITGDGVLYLNPSVTSIGGTASTVSSPFYNIANVVSVDFSDSLITNIGNYTFNNCSGLTTIVYPSGLTTIGTQVFNNCGLTEITIPSGVTSIGNIAYNGCSSATTVSIPSTVTSIGDRAFCYCTGITSIEFPEGVSSLGERVCDGDTGLTSVIIPSTVTSIGSNAFRGCSALTSVTCKATSVPTLSTGSFTISGDTLYVPYASLSSYQNNSTWSSAFTSIRPIGYTYISVSASGNGSVSGMGWYEIGTTATITAIADSYYRFIGWNDGNTDNPRMISVGSTDLSYTASFEGMRSITYNASTPVSGDWVTNNTETGYNYYDATSHTGIIYLKSGVTAIGGGQSTSNSPFYGKTDLKSVDLSDSGLTSLSSSGFRGCTGLEELTIPSTVTYIGYNVFDNCTSLGTVTCYATTPPTLYSDFPAISDVLYVPYSSLSSYQNHNTWGNAFPYIYSIGFTRRAIRYNAGTPATGNWVTSYTHTDLNTYNSQTGNGILYLVGDEWGGDVTSIGNTPDYAPFYQKTDLVAIDMSDSVITEIGDWGFSGCTNLTNVTLPSTLTGVHGFSGCTSLASITLPSGLTHIGDFAFGATGLTSITIPSGVTLVGNGAFQECSSLTSITLPSTLNWLGDGVVTNQGVFKNCTSLVSVIGLEDTNIDTIVAETFQGCTSLTSITLPSSLTEIKASAFDCANLTTVTCLATTPPTLASGNFTASDDTLYVPFASLSAYQSATAWVNAFTNISPSSVPQIRYNASTQATGNWVTSNTDTTSNTYDSITGDGVLYLNAGVTTIGGGGSTDNSPFYGKTDLVSVDLSDSEFTAIGSYAFQGCTSLTSITIPDTVTELGRAAISTCSNLAMPTLPSGLTSIGDYCFYKCSSIASVNVPSTVTNIGENAFQDCTSLTSVTLPTTLTTIKAYTFRGCSALRTITIPSTVTSIATQGFYNCTLLKTVTCLATTPPSLGGNNFNTASDKLYVPSASLNTYKNTTAWKNAFTSIYSF